MSVDQAALVHGSASKLPDDDRTLSVRRKLSRTLRVRSSSGWPKRVILNFMTSKLFSLIVIIILIASYGITKNLLGAGIVDDSYIFLRYADNFANGYGLVFNPGEYVEGYSSPLWMFILAGVALINPPDLPLITTSLSGLLGAATITLYFVCGQRDLPPEKKLFAAIPCWYLATNPSFSFWSWSGMDTALFVFLFSLSFFLFLEQVTTSKTLFLSGGVFFLAMLTRLDMVATLPVYLLGIVWLNRHQPHTVWQKSCSFLLPLSLLTIHFLWRYSYYQDLLPNTYYAKVGIPHTILLSNGLNYLVAFLLVYALLLAMALVMPLFLAYSTKRLQWKWGFCWAVIMTWCGYVLYVGGDHFVLFRFYLPIIVLLTYLFTILIQQIMLTAKSARLMFALLLVMFILTGVNMFIYTNYTGGARAKREVHLAESWKQVGLWLKQNVPPDTTIAVLTAGAIPYYSQLKTYDLLGLTNREIGKHGKSNLGSWPGHQKYDTDFIISKKPDYIIHFSAGIFNEPKGNHSSNPLFAYPLYNIVNDPRTDALYEYQAIKLNNGRYIEFLKSKQKNHERDRLD